MRVIYIFVCTFLLMISTACTDKKDTDKILTLAEQLLSSNPDSVLILLDCIKGGANDLSTDQRMKYILLRTQAMNATDVPLDTMIGVRMMAEYYDSHGSANEKIKAYYMLGSMYRDRGDSPTALSHYRKAVSVADTSAADCDFRTLSRIYGQMASLFYHQLAPELSHDAEIKAVEYAEKAKDTLAAIIFYEHMGTTYRMQKKYDSVLYIANNTYQKYKAIGQDKLAAGTLPQAIDVYLIKGQYDKAKQAMDECEQYSGLFDKNGNIVKGREIYYDSKGLYYENIGKLDSAEYFYRKLLNYKATITNIECGYKGLVSVYQKLGVADSVVKYAELFVQTNDSSSFLNSSENIIKMQALYNYNEKEQIAAAKTQEVERYKYMIFVIFVFCSAIAFFVYNYIKVQRKKGKEELAQTNKKHYETLILCDKSEKELKLLKENFEKYKEEKDTEIRLLKVSLLQNGGNENVQGQLDIKQALLSLSVVRRLHEYAGKIKQPTSADWRELHKITADVLPDFYKKITDESVSLTPVEISTCILIKLYFIPNEMVVLFNLSKQRITNIRRNINKKLFNQDGATSLDARIQNI